MNVNIGLDIISPIDRLMIYEKMLRSYKWSLYTPKYFHNTRYGICFWLWQNTDVSTPFGQLYNYPELKNPGILSGYGYWWERGKIQPRILAIQQAISDVKKVI